MLLYNLNIQSSGRILDEPAVGQRSPAIHVIVDCVNMASI